ncbi:alpha/beta hydrolase [Bacillus sp. AFS018417]|uniref:alpha/beta fold hydrolase n=1 Tax=Bacillus sp. AFS018417 TaxID=2033491 RepID=UPI000BF60B17|nr:alpha/beta hydrolase [Bacillus sp. AFS018417]PEZ09274.1 alpha/beta hydrolase [Bacillus sp. AFS018417]
MPHVQLQNGATYYYEMRGEGESILFIHGSGASWKIWEPQFEVFSKHYKMILVDMRGHGGSTKEFPNRQYSMKVIVEDMKEFLDALGISSIPVIGLSQGGVIASLLACTHPSYVQKLVLSNSYSEVPTMGAGCLLTVSNAIFSILPYWIILKLIMIPYGEDTYTKQVILNSLSVDKSMLLAMKKSEFPTHTNDLHKITASTLVLCGDKKNVGPEEKAGNIIFNHIPKATLGVFKNAFDPLTTMRRDIFNEMVLDFLGDRPLQSYEDVTYTNK